MSDSATIMRPDLSVFARIPLALTEGRQFLVWCLEQSDSGKPTKVPYAVNGYPAATTNPKHWSTYSEALDTFASGQTHDGRKFDGIGRVFTPEDFCTGIDLDNSLDDAGQLMPWAEEIYRKVPSYAEISPSGSGVKMWIGGRLDSDGRERGGKKKKPYIGVGTGLEVYDRGRFFTMTGRRYGDAPTTVIEHPAALLKLYDSIFPPEVRKPVDTSPADYQRHEPGDRLKRCMAYLDKCPASISGENGHDKALRAACEAFRFDLNESDKRHLMQWWNDQKSDEKWTERELEHKIDSARKLVPPAEIGCRLREDRPSYRPSSNGNGNGHRGHSKHTERVTSTEAAPDASETEPTESYALQDVAELIEKYPEQDPPRIKGVCRIGETVTVVSASKIGKTFLAWDMGIACATGQPWLGFATEPCDVLVIDNELRKGTLSYRCRRVLESRGLNISDVQGRIQTLSLRGRLMDIHKLGTLLFKIEPSRFGLVIIDAVYRMLPEGTSENDNAQMMQVYNEIDRHAERLGATFILIHHASKGNQSGKGVTDVGSGAGSMSRATDCHIILRPHEDDGAVVMEGALRSFAPLKPMALRWSPDALVWTPAPDLDPTRLKRDPTKGGRPRKEKAADETAAQPWTVERFAAEIIAAKPQSKSAIGSKSERAGLKLRQIAGLLDEAEDAGLIFRHAKDGSNAVFYSTQKPELFDGVSVSRAPPTPPRARRKRRRGT